MNNFFFLNNLILILKQPLLKKMNENHVYIYNKNVYYKKEKERKTGFFLRVKMEKHHGYNNFCFFKYKIKITQQQKVLKVKIINLCSIFFS